MPHPVHAAADAIYATEPYPADVVAAAVELYDTTTTLLLDRRPLFGDVAESLALACLSVADYLGPDTVQLTLIRHGNPVGRLMRERFGR
jgi:hypothetical protein